MLRHTKYLEDKKYFTWKSSELERPREVEEGVAGVEDVGALRGRGDLGLVSALPGRAQLGSVLQGEASVTVVHYHHCRPGEREIIRNTSRHTSVLRL